MSAIRERLVGYKQALRAHGIGADPRLVVCGGHTIRGGYEACLELLKRELRSTAIFSTNNLMLSGTLMALQEKGLSCPEDVSLLGFDDFDEAALLSPPLFVVAQRSYEMGLCARELLLERLAGNPAHATTRQIRLDTYLVQRGSMAAPSTKAQGGDSRRKPTFEHLTETAVCDGTQDSAIPIRRFPQCVGQ